MSAGCALHPAYSSLFVQTTSIPGLQDASKIGPLVKQTVIPGGGRGKSNTIAYEDLFVKIQETADLPEYDNRKGCRTHTRSILPLFLA
jgi:hypothetical protein